MSRASERASAASSLHPASSPKTTNLGDSTNTTTLAFALQVLDVESKAVLEVARAVDDRFLRAVELIFSSTGAGRANAVVTTGVGKAGHIARKLSATLSSTGTPSHFLNPTDAAHGDLGSVREGDIVLILSASGESEELIRIISLVKKLGNPLIAITASTRSSLGRHADIVLETGKIPEACPLGLAPSASTTAMLALCDALALCVMKRRHFTADDFALFHPAGQLGRKLMSVADAMSFRMGENLPVAPDTLTIAEVLHHASKIKRRSGAVILIGPDGRLTGLFTDGDLRRVITNSPDALQKPISQVMTHNPKRIRSDQLASEAMALMHKHRFDELPVVDEHDKPVGLIDVQDLVLLRMLDVDEKE
jgi:arabinose-5-phosphate isomerase